MIILVRIWWNKIRIAVTCSSNEIRIPNLFLVIFVFVSLGSSIDLFLPPVSKLLLLLLLLLSD